jgi:hypothetical protein
MLSGKKFSAIMWAGTIGSLITWWVVASRAPQQEWPMIFPFASCLLLVWDLVRKDAGS